MVLGLGWHNSECVGTRQRRDAIIRCQQEWLGEGWLLLFPQGNRWAQKGIAHIFAESRPTLLTKELSARSRFRASQPWSTSEMGGTAQRLKAMHYCSYAAMLHKSTWNEANNHQGQASAQMTGTYSNHHMECAPRNPLEICSEQYT